MCASGKDDIQSCDDRRGVPQLGAVSTASNPGPNKEEKNLEKLIETVIRWMDSCVSLNACFSFELCR